MSAMDVMDGRDLAAEGGILSEDGEVAVDTNGGGGEKDEDVDVESSATERPQHWTRAEEERLQYCLSLDMSLKEIAGKMSGRSERALRHRVSRLRNEGPLSD